jgi:chemotaxis protein CheC
MTIDASELSDIERDALAEIANMGVSRAAASLRQMVGQQVLLSVPAVSIVTRHTASLLVERGNAPKLVAVQQSFQGPFSGRALLIFPEAQSLELVRSIVGAEHSLEDHRSGTGSACRDGQYYLERMLGNDRQRTAPHDADIAPVGCAR